MAVPFFGRPELFDLAPDLMRIPSVPLGSIDAEAGEVLISFVAPPSTQGAAQEAARFFVDELGLLRLYASEIGAAAETLNRELVRHAEGSITARKARIAPR